MKITFERREELVAGIWQYYFRPERPMDFVPGQYAEIQLANVTDDPRGGSRTFSLTSLPGDASLRFVLKHFALQSPYKHALERLQPGDEAMITDAMGDLILPKDTSQPIVFVAGGIGIASYVSMFRDLLARKEARSVFLFYQVRSARERLFRELLRSYPLELDTFVIEPNRIHGKQLLDSTPPGALIYLSGSQKFVERLRQELEALGTPRSQIVFDYYDGYADL